MKSNFLKILVIATLMISSGLVYPLRMAGKVIAANMATPMATIKKGIIIITIMRRPGQFMWSVIIGRLLPSGTITRRLCIMQLRRQAGSSLECPLPMVVLPSILV